MFIRVHVLPKTKCEKVSLKTRLDDLDLCSMETRRSQLQGSTQQLNTNSVCNVTIMFLSGRSSDCAEVCVSKATIQDMSDVVMPYMPNLLNKSVQIRSLESLAGHL